jgi:uncharacterized protein YdiU (UPF0061 family)
MSHSNTLNNLKFNNRYLQALPADPETDNHRRQVLDAGYSFVNPTPVSNPSLVAVSPEVAELIGLDLTECESAEFTQVFAGNKLLEGMQPYALCYGGHQFGNWAGQLGDGRAINLGEVITPQGTQQTLQLKGAGPTPYSRMADGLAVLRSSVREFLCSEAMHHLGVPTTRALSLILTGEEVRRDMFYDGRPAMEPGAIVCRVSPSFTRFGSFEIFASRGDTVNLKKLADHTIQSNFSHLLSSNKTPDKDTYLAWFSEVCDRTAEMIVHWMRVGFVHGVMNTDNMSILGETIDYGPYGWLEDYNPGWTPNTTDKQERRYRYGDQPKIAHWNLFQLANAIYPLIKDEDALHEILDDYGLRYQQRWQTMRAEKLGLNTFEPDTDTALNHDLHTLLQQTETDMTLFYRHLAGIPADDMLDDDALIAPLIPAFYTPDTLPDNHLANLAMWCRQYQQRIQQDGTDDATRRTRMHAVNPKYVLRNYMAQLAIDAADEGDYGVIHELLDVLRHPYDEQSEHAKYAAKRPDWARSRAGCSMLSCSS